MNTLHQDRLHCDHTVTDAVAVAPEFIAERICQSLLEELETYPKPGLVSFIDCGSHPDMDAAVFVDSINILRPWFTSLAQAGQRLAPFSELQQIGILAEKAMMQRTGNRNTHRGALFSLGLLAAAAGARDVGEWTDETNTLGEIVRLLWADAIPLPHAAQTSSHGSIACKKYKVTGARGEAIRGFPSVYQCGLPVFRRYLKQVDVNRARVQTFCELFMVCEDTTTLYRGGLKGYRFARKQIGAFLKSGGVLRDDWLDCAVAIHRSFIARNLTAGGTADLLAATLFVHSMELQHE